MTVGVIGKRYASALLQLAIGANAVDRMGRDLSDFAAVWQQARELRTVFENPDFGVEVRRQILRELATRSMMATEVRNLLLLLSDRGRMRYAPEIADTYQALAEERSGKVRAEVIVAAEMPESYFVELQRTLEAVTGKQVTIVKKKDPSLIGGVVTRVGDRVFDGSVRNRLRELKNELRRTATPAVGPTEAAK